MHKVHGCSHNMLAFSPEVLSTSRKRRFLAHFMSSSRHVQVPTKRLSSSPPRLSCRSPGPCPSVSSLSCPRPSLFWVMKPTLAHTTALTASHTPVSPTDTAGTHSHFTHAQAEPHESTALIRMGKGYHLDLGGPGSLWLATALGSSAAVSRSRHDSTPTASFEVRLVDLLWPQLPLACGSHQTSTPGPLSLVVAACAKDAWPSCWRCYSGARSRQRRDTESVENGRSFDVGRRGWRPVASWWAESKYNRRGSAQRGSGGSGGQVCTLAQSRKGAWSGPLRILSEHSGSWTLRLV